MMFVDGENFTLRGEAVASALGVSLQEGPYYLPHVFLWFPARTSARDNTCLGDPNRRSAPFERGLANVEERAIRSFYYTATTGNNDRRDVIVDSLWKWHFHPEVFLKARGSRSKQVDITLARDCLSHAFRNNYDTAILLAGDQDYLPLVDEIKRLGKHVCLCFFEHQAGGLSTILKRASDEFLPLDDLLANSWNGYKGGPK